MMNELARIKQNRSGELPDGPYWLYGIKTLNLHASEILRRIIEIAELIADQSKQSWPSDDEWRSLLPSWFLDSFKSYTQEEAEAIVATTPREEWHKLPWEFGSWLDAIRYRGWAWWSSKMSEDEIEICLSIHEWPASLEAFEHIIHASGAVAIRKTAIGM
jgi:hypothetical protein